MSTAAKSAIHAASAAPVPGASVGGDILIAIINLCEAVAQKRHYPFRGAINHSNSLTGALLATSPRDAKAYVFPLGNMRRSRSLSGQLHIGTMSLSQLSSPQQ